MHVFSLWLAAAVAVGVRGQSSSTSTDTRFTTITGSISSSSITGTYDTNTNQVTNTQSSGLVNRESTSASSGTATTTSAGSTSTVTLLLGGGAGVETLSVINGTSTIYPNSTASASRSTTRPAQPTNTQPCNGWPEFCQRSYGNVTQVAAHNAAFVVPGNAGSNQEYSLTQQLDDGIRMLTGETQYVNDTFYSCHTSCDLLNAGTFQKNLEEIAAWVRTHPYDVVTLLIVNSNFRPVEDYIAPLQGSGLGPYLYEPPYFPMRLSQWPTLSSMILSQKRVVVFMDYNANQTSVPYILDEFRHIWETPFSPQNISFPCDLERPPQLTNQTEARYEFMYLANHNLNTAVSFAGTSFLIPNTAQINNTNAAGLDTGMLGAMAQGCDAQWGRPPNWLLVDYYDRVGGSVFEVAARWNNVTYDRPCCGYPPSSPAAKLSGSTPLLLTAGLCAVAWLFA